MRIEVTEASPEILKQYESVPILFRVDSVLTAVPVDSGLGGIRLAEEPVEPYFKDYDQFESERPAAWPAQFDISKWTLFSAFEGEGRAGGAAVVTRSGEIDMLEGRDDLVCLWDLRVAPEYRGKGVAHRLFTRVAEWAREQGCRRLKVETQNTNVPACRFYARQGCELRGIDSYAYAERLNEIQLLWYLDLDLP